MERGARLRDRGGAGTHQNAAPAPAPRGSGTSARAASAPMSMRASHGALRGARGLHGAPGVSQTPLRTRWPAGQPWPQPAARKPCVEEADSLLVEPPVGFVLRQEDFHRLARGLGVRVCWVRAPRPRMLERVLRQRQLHRGEVGVWSGEVGARPVLRGSRNTALTCDTTRLPNMAGSTWARRRNESSMRSTMPIQRYLRGVGGREGVGKGD